MIDLVAQVGAVGDYIATQSEINRLLRGPGLFEPNRKRAAGLMYAQAAILMMEYYLRGLRRGCCEPLKIQSSPGPSSGPVGASPEGT